MERGDRILLWAFGLALATLVMCCLLHSFPSAGRTFWTIIWTQEAAGWAQAVGTVAAVLSAVVIARADRRQRVKREEAIAAMRVASRLRYWLGPCAGALADLGNWISSSEQAGSNKLSIPALDIDLNDVAQLPVARAKRIYSIIEQRARAVEAVSGDWEFGTWDDAATTFRKESAKLFRRVRTQYREMAAELGLHPSTCQAWELSVVNKAAREGRVRGWKDLVGQKRQDA